MTRDGRIKELLRKRNRHGLDCRARHTAEAKDCICGYSQALALLDPPCTRCGGSGQVDDDKAGNSHMLTLMECPKCQPEKK